MEPIIHEYSTEVKMSSEEAATICRLGQLEKCCAFLIIGPEGFECIRMSYPTNTTIFSRLESGEMKAKGEGLWKGCYWEKYSNK